MYRLRLWRWYCIACQWTTAQCSTCCSIWDASHDKSHSILCTALITSIILFYSNSILLVPVAWAPPSVYGGLQLASFPLVFSSPLFLSFSPAPPVLFSHTHSQNAVSPPEFSHQPECYRTVTFQCVKVKDVHVLLLQGRSYYYSSTTR